MKGHRPKEAVLQRQRTTLSHYIRCSGAPHRDRCTETLIMTKNSCRESMAATITASISWTIW